MYEYERGTSTTFDIHLSVHKNFTLFISNHETERTLETIPTALTSCYTWQPLLQRRLSVENVTRSQDVDHCCSMHLCVSI